MPLCHTPAADKMDTGSGDRDDAFLMDQQLLDRPFPQMSLDRDIPLKLGTIEGSDPALGERGEMRSHCGATGHT